MKKNYVFRLPAEEVKSLMELHFDLISYEKCMELANNLDEREYWRKKFVTARVSMNGELEALFYKYADAEIAQAVADFKVGCSLPVVDFMVNCLTVDVDDYQ